MRLARLDLVRFGRFTGHSLAFPHQAHDLHIIFGENEAGKTTSMVAIEDLLFGIPHNSTLDFRHEYKEMRLGGLIERGHDGRAKAAFEFRRRKGRKDTILGIDERPLHDGETRLASFLSGTDRAFFERMFNLDPVRLAAGARAMLDQAGDVGQTLFAAATGLAGVRRLLDDLTREADEVWGRRKAQGKAFYKAQSQFEDARTALREHSLSADDWQSARRERDAAQAEQDELERDRARLVGAQSKLARQRRCLPHVRRLDQIEKEIAGLGVVRRLPADARAIVDQAVRKRREAQARRGILDDQIAQARSRKAGIEVDRTLLARADEIARLRDRWIELQGQREALPAHRAALATELAALQRLARELGHGDDLALEDLASLIPPRESVLRIRALANRGGAIETAYEKAAAALEDARFDLAAHERRLDLARKPVEVSDLVALVDAAAIETDHLRRMREINVQRARDADEIAALAASLAPHLEEGRDVRRLVVPPESSVSEFARLVRSCEERRDATARELQQRERDLARQQQMLAHEIEREGIASAQSLIEARDRRDRLWQAVRTGFIDLVHAPADPGDTLPRTREELPGAFEDAVRGADEIADRRFDKAESAGRLRQLERQIVSCEADCVSLRNTAEALRAERADLARAWADLWASAAITPDDPAVMLDWLKRLDRLGQLLARDDASRADLVSLEQAVEARCDLIRETLASKGFAADVDENADLVVLISHAGGAIRRAHEDTAVRQTLEERVEEAKIRLVRAQGEAETLRADLERWRADMKTALEAAGLDGASRGEVVEGLLALIDDMRNALSRVRKKRDEEIATIERDLKAFEASLAALVQDVAPDLRSVALASAVGELESRRRSATEQSRTLAALDAEIADKTGEVEGLVADDELAWAVVRPLQEVLGSEDTETLEAAIERSEQLRELEAERTRLGDELLKAGDGLNAAALKEECAGLEPDLLPAREVQIKNDLDDLQARLASAADRRAEARKRFDAFAGTDAAARAEAARQEAIAAMHESAERYVTLRSSALVLRRAIDRFREEHQGPLLRRASELFRILTGGSFTELATVFDENDRVHLAGTRANGDRVAIGGMSSGSEDQLYLALRLAAVEDCLSKGTILPFIADDLFINFDDQRARAGLLALNELSTRTQVLFFTHHAHLVDLAREALGERVHHVDLQPGARD